MPPDTPDSIGGSKESILKMLYDDVFEEAYLSALESDRVSLSDEAMTSTREECFIVIESRIRRDEWLMRCFPENIVAIKRILRWEIDHFLPAEEGSVPTSNSASPDGNPGLPGLQTSFA